MHRGGSGGGADYFKVYVNCTGFCVRVMAAGSLESPVYPACDPHFASCSDGLATAPLNGRRVAFPSQYGTSQMDPSLSATTPITNVTACLRMIFFRFRVYISSHSSLCDYVRCELSRK